MSGSNPIESPCNYVMIGGKRTPGFAEPVGAGSPREWDKRRGMGMSGAICVFMGRDLATFSVMCKLVTPQDWQDYYAFLPTVMKLPKRRAFGGQRRDSGMLDIWHPYLEALQINAVGVVDVLQPILSDDTGEWTWEIKLIEFRQPKFTLAKPEGAAATPVDPIEEEVIKPLTGLLESLAAE